MKLLHFVRLIPVLLLKLYIMNCNTSYGKKINTPTDKNKGKSKIFRKQFK